MFLSITIIGIIGGFISGFFGVGGGTILVPLLLYVGFDIKTAIGISVMQMLFSSIFGSFLNYKNGSLNFKNSFTLGVGGLFGAFASGFFIKAVDGRVLEYLFLFVIVFAIYRFFKTSLEDEKKPLDNNIIIFAVGVVVGFIAISLGIGGALLLTPILVSFLHFDIKRAASLALFFVIFSSSSGFISLSYNGLINYHYGLVVGVASLIGVFFGIKIASKIDAKRFKNYLLVLNITILLLLLNRMIG